MRAKIVHFFQGGRKPLWMATVLCLLFSWAFLIFFVSPGCAAGIPVSLKARLAAETTPDGVFPLAVVEVRVSPGYHAYAHNAAGRPLALGVFVEPSDSARAQVLYPSGHAIPDPLDPNRKIDVVSGDFRVFARLLKEPGKRPDAVTLDLSMLLCSQQNCVPVAQTFTLPIPRTDALPAIDAETSAALAASTPVDTNPLTPATPQGQGLSRSPSAGTDDSAAPEKAVGSNAPNAPAATGKTLDALKGGAAPLPGALKQTAAPSASDRPDAPAAPRFTPRYHAQSLEPQSLLFALALGLLAGLTLNVMPCVLPVLTIKITGLLAFSGADEKTLRRRFCRYNLFFAAGVMAWFALLALLMAGAGLAWGGLFQRKELVFGLMMLVFLLGLSLFETFTLPGLRLKGAAPGRPGTEAFISGMTVTLLATPCSGPLLGGVLAFAALQPPLVQVLVFVCTGAGMALPYLALAAFPGIARRLPKPGAWMETVERIAGFFLMGTALYLLSILPESLRLAALCALLASAFAAWCWGRFGGLGAAPFRRFLVGALCLACVVGSSCLALTPPKSSPAVWESFSSAIFDSKLGNTPVLVEFTADWCPTCKALEKTTLRPERLQKLAERHNLTLLKVDLTGQNPDGETLLKALGSVSIPLTAIFPAGGMASHPLVLRDVYTFAQLEAALDEALGVNHGKK